MVELDVRQTGDRALIIFHDDRINGRYVRDLDLKTVRKMGHQIGIDIPCLEQVLRITRKRIKLDIEIKEQGHEREILDLVLKYESRKNVIFTSFHLQTTETIKAIDPRFRVGLILGKKKSGISGVDRWIEPPFKERILAPRIDFLIVHWKLLKPGFASALIWRQQKNILVWTVNSRRKILKFLKDKRISGIITDRPGIAHLLSQKLGAK